MTKVRLKRPVLYSLYVIAVVAFIGILYVAAPTRSVLKIEDNKTYVSSSILDNSKPVMKVEQSIIKPYKDENISVLQSYYDYTAENESQENSIIYYENTYMQSTGISYGGEKPFEIIAVLDGIVESVEDDELMGTIIKIKHEDGTYSIYESVSDVKVKENDEVKQGDVIAVSGESVMQKELGSHLYFEFVLNGNVVNPENCYGKVISEL